MDASVAKRTQETLGKIIRKPPLTEKLLSKPPFRFLHDIITEVINNTGFFKGLYSTEEMDSANVKEKDAKIMFLQKAIDCVVMVNGDSLSVRPSKVVAGQEAEKTNEFLQAIAKAISNKRDSGEAVKKVLAGEKPNKSDSRKKDSRSGSGSRERPKDQNKTRESTKKDQERKEVDSSRRREPSSKGSSDERRRRDDSGKKDKDKDREKDKERTERERERQREKGREKEKEKEREREREREKISKKEDEPHVDDLDGEAGVDGNTEDGDAPPNRIPRPSSAKGQRRRPQDEAEDSLEGENDGTAEADDGRRQTEQMNGVMNDNEELPPQVIASRRMPRPSSARPAPPKMKKKQEELDEPAARIGSGKVANVIVDNGKDDDEDDTFVVDDSHLQQNHIDAIPSTEGTEDDGEHGGLVRKILETKRELEGTVAQQESRPVAPVSDAARRKERELAQKEIEKLRTSIQTLTRSANPLGKIMDYIQEDMDSMHKELEMWRRENREHAIALKREESITESEIEPLKSKLAELGTEISEMVDRISTIKCNVLKNDEKIQKMLGSISFSSR